MDLELVNLIKNQVIEAIKREYFLVKKINKFDGNDQVKNETFIMFATKIVCDYFKVDIDSVMSGSGMRNQSNVRRIVAVLCREVCNPSISYNQIGKYFGKNHATMLHTYREALRISEVDKSYKEDIIKLKQVVNKSFNKEITL